MKISYPDLLYESVTLYGIDLPDAGWWKRPPTPVNTSIPGFRPGTFGNAKRSRIIFGPAELSHHP
jgi:hypothetical protein